MEIEKKYLVEEPPGDLHARPFVSIEQGYLIVTESEELRVRKKGQSHYLTFKKGLGTTRQEIEIAISEDQYRDFLQHVVGSVIHKKRFGYPFRDLTIEIDVYRRNLEGLLVAEVEFDSKERMKEFEPPAWLGREISSAEEFKNKNLALRGFPPDLRRKWKRGFRPAWHYRQSGVVPFRKANDGYHVLLITTRKTGKWIVPKGIIEPDLSPAESAAKEALEEAGVTGRMLDGIQASYSFDKWNGRCGVTLFALLVEELLEDWAESADRRRKWVHREDVAEHVQNTELSKSVSRIVREIAETSTAGD